MFAVYSANHQQPELRDWYRTQADAEAALPDFRRVDREIAGREDEEYYVVELADAEVAFYRAAGFRGTGE